MLCSALTLGITFGMGSLIGVIRTKACKQVLWCAGANLLRYTLRRPSQAASAPRVLHRLAKDDAFVALACPAGPESCSAYSGSGLCATAPNLLAASTLREVLLLDLRRPGRALLKWAHGAFPAPACHAWASTAI